MWTSPWGITMPNSPNVLKQRMRAGKWAKAERGEFAMRLPMGYFRRPSGDIVKDPDEQAQAVIGVIFDQFERCGTIYGVLQHLVRHGILLPHRAATGPAKGELEWRRPNRVTLSNLLHHPMYAGAYVYGRRPSDPRRQQAGRSGTGRTVAAPGEWQVLRRGELPAYISWERFLRNAKQLEANRAEALGTVRRGASLLSGLLTYGRCGLRMATYYQQNGRGLRYACARGLSNYGDPPCQSLSRAPLDQLVSELVLKALEPAALELSIEVARDVDSERQQLHRHWTQRLERARYEAERAFRQYNAVDPENRLVARTLERQWEATLEEEERLKVEHARFLEQHPAVLSLQECAEIRRLASDIPALWHAPTTNTMDRQAIIRHLVERIAVTILDGSERVEVKVHWAGGSATQAHITRPVGRLEQLSNYPQLLARVAALHAEGHSGTMIATLLNAEGWRPAKGGLAFTRAMVVPLLAKQGLASSPLSPSSQVVREANEWTLKELVRELAMPQQTLQQWLRIGKLNARLAQARSRPIWLIRADADEIARLRQLRTASSRRTALHSASST